MDEEATQGVIILALPNPRMELTRLLSAVCEIGWACRRAGQRQGSCQNRVSAHARIGRRLAWCPSQVCRYALSVQAPVARLKW
jgi:hypothetical protein